VGQRVRNELREVAAAHPRPAVLAHVNLHCFKPYNVVLGYQRGDALLQQVQRQLEQLGRAWRVAGDEFVALIAGPLEPATGRLRAFSWLSHTVIGATEAWRFRFADGRELPAVPWRSFEVMCTPRCGIAALLEGGSAEAALALAERRCEELRIAAAARRDDAEPSSPADPGFAPLASGPWSNPRQLASPTCPLCAAPRSEIVDEDLGWASERCTRCLTSYERSDVLIVLGEESSAGYM
jgi:GGDEF domain-containing protein